MGKRQTSKEKRKKNSEEKQKKQTKNETVVGKGVTSYYFGLAAQAHSQLRSTKNKLEYDLCTYQNARRRIFRRPVFRRLG